MRSFRSNRYGVDEGQFKDPYGIAVDAAGNIVVVDGAEDFNQTNALCEKKSKNNVLTFFMLACVSGLIVSVLQRLTILV